MQKIDFGLHPAAVDLPKGAKMIVIYYLEKVLSYICTRFLFFLPFWVFE